METEVLERGTAVLYFDAVWFFVNNGCTMGIVSAF